ncbi:DNA-processing protein DprA [Clostridium sp.]|uniref:DNA-processing protein DprA n=1 Tax=Clostridium sp. TaxID=1506 RepID=UPI003F37F2AB
MKNFILWYIMLKISNKSKVYLLQKYKNEKSIYNNIDDIKNGFMLSIKEKEEIKSISNDEIIIFEKYLQREGIKYITLNSSEYPESLTKIEEPPYVLFYKGDLSLIHKRAIGIVGSRNCTNYGREVTKVITKELCESDIVVISGVASGIDSVSHKIALEEGGKTIGVLGCGINIVYPKINANLYREIIKNGLLISEFMPDTAPFAYNFPRRNRIISGISEGVIVSEASLKSGSLITVSYALDQGKKIMAVPGSVIQRYSIGCNKLIKDGAEVFTELEDLTFYFNLNKIYKKNKGINSNKVLLLNLISREPIHLDDIIKSVNVDRQVLFELLFEMQNRNEIICLSGNYYAKLS